MKAPKVRVPEKPASIMPKEASTPRRAHVVRSQIWAARFGPRVTVSFVLTAKRVMAGTRATPSRTRMPDAGTATSSMRTSYPFGVRLRSANGSIVSSPFARAARISVSERTATSPRYPGDRDKAFRGCGDA